MASQPDLRIDAALQKRQARADAASAHMHQWTREEFAYWWAEYDELVRLSVERRDYWLAEMRRRFPDATP